MGSDWAIGGLAFITIGGVLALSIFHFGYQLKDPDNLAAAKSVAKDRESAATAVSAEGVNGRSLRQRLDEAPGLDDSLSVRSPPTSDVADVLFDMKWSALVAIMKGARSPKEEPGEVYGR